MELTDVLLCDGGGPGGAASEALDWLDGALETAIEGGSSVVLEVVFPAGVAVVVEVTEPLYSFIGMPFT